MNKALLGIGIFITFAFIGLLLFSEEISDLLINDERPSNVSENSLYSGGDWIELVEKIDNSNYRFKIYQRGSGDLKIDAIFSLSDPSCTKVIDSTNIYNNVKYYDGAILLKKHKIFKSLDCQLVPTEIFYLKETPRGVIKLKEK